MMIDNKFFISKTIIGDEPDYQKFIIDPLAGSKSSELSSIYYEIIDGDWNHKGFSSKGDPLHEIWSQRR